MTQETKPEVCAWCQAAPVNMQAILTTSQGERQGISSGHYHCVCKTACQTPAVPLLVWNENQRRILVQLREAFVMGYNFGLGDQYDVPNQRFDEWMKTRRGGK